MPDGGQLLINGQDVTYGAPYERDIGMVFQNYALFPHMTVAENIAFPLKMRQASTAPSARRRADEALELVRLPHVAQRFPRELSGGQQQRIALARCLVYHPSIVLMDEPLGALDKKLRDQMQLEIKRIHRETGTTIVYVTHDQEEAMTMSDRICLMNDGRSSSSARRRISTSGRARSSSPISSASRTCSRHGRAAPTAPACRCARRRRHARRRGRARRVAAGSKVRVMVRPQNIASRTRAAARVNSCAAACSTA